MTGQATRKAGTARPRRWSEGQSVRFYHVVEAIAALFFRFYVRCFRVFRADHVPDSGGAFLVANHTSAIDPIVLGLAVHNRMLTGPGKAYLFENRFFAYLLWKIGIFPLRTGTADTAAVRTMLDLYRHGRIVTVYPEGGRSDSGEMQEFTPDFARLIVKLKAPVIPAGIAGARDLLPIGSWIPHYHTPVTVVFGPGFELSEFYGRELTPEVLQDAAQMLFDRVAGLVAEARRQRDLLARNC